MVQVLVLVLMVVQLLLLLLLLLLQQQLLLPWVVVLMLLEVVLGECSGSHLQSPWLPLRGPEFLITELFPDLNVVGQGAQGLC